jgi:hypothetical protein
MYVPAKYRNYSEANMCAVSGGGGWGAKKGLLSLDPQRRHFALSEEEELERFMQTMDVSSFAPPGSHIQFFASSGAGPAVLESMKSDMIFGTPGPVSQSSEPEPSTEDFSMELHFGALSNHGVYVSNLQGPDHVAASGPDESKLNVPHARISVGEVPRAEGGLWQFFAGGMTLATRDTL